MTNSNRLTSRPPGRLFYCLLISLLLVMRAHATGPALTTITDIVYRADGSPAGGTLVITWPNFSTADNKAVAAGELHITIGTAGAITVALAPNVGSTPFGTYYKVVYKLDDGTTSTEYWLIPAAGPTTIAAIRSTVVPSQVAAQLASKQYVDAAVGGAVHIAGTESITGAKSFALSPTAPTPTVASAVATKSYVDALVGGGGGSGYLPLSGGTMTGSLFLWHDPTSPTQPATRNYVDIATATLTAGIGSRLSRINDSPITLAGVRYADSFAGASVGGQIDAACADLSGANGIVVVPSTLGAGWSVTGVPSNCTIYDFRGAGGSTQVAFARGTDFYGRYTSVGSGLQIVSPMMIEFDAYSGGVSNIATTKTQWQGIRLEGKGRTIGERKGAEINLSTYGKGDSIGIMASSYDAGGYSTGGDEGSEGGRFMSVQGDTSSDGGFARGTVASVSGNIITGTWTAGTNASLGELRPLINTSRGVYNIGSVASVSASGSPVVCTVNGSGTSWSSLGTGAKTDLFLEITSNSNGATKHVVPITSITDDTHLVVEYSLAELGPTCYSTNMVTSGVYNIYKGGSVTSLSSPASGNLNASAVNLASGGSNFVAGDTIQQPLGYNYHGVGTFTAVSRLVGEPQGAGVYAHNTGALAFRDGFRASGPFINGISFDSGTLTGFGVLFANPVTGGLLRSSDTTASSQVVNNLLNSGGTQRTLTYDRTNDWWQWSSGQYFSASDQRIGIGTTPQASTLGYFFYNNAAWDGLILAPSATPNAGKAIFDTQVAGVPRLRVENSRVIVNNGSDLAGYSDDRATQKWKITGADGTILGSTINATTGFQVNGTALNFSNIAGTLGITAGGTGTTTSTGSAGSVVLSNSPTIVTPTVASFVNANHDHSNSAGGGNISTTAVTSANKTGTGTKFATGTGTYTSGNCVKIDAAGNLIDNGSACGGSGGTPAGSSGNLQWNSSGTFAGLAGSTSDNLTDVSAGSSNMLSLSRTYTIGSTTNAIHAVDSALTYTGSAKENTISSNYGRILFQGTGGCGHCITFAARAYDNGVGGSTDSFDNYYSDFNFFGSATATQTVTQATHFHAVNGLTQGASGNAYSDFAGFRYETQTVSSPTTMAIEQAFVTQMPASANAQKTAFYGLRTGGCTQSAKYSAMCIDGGASYFKQGLDQTLTFDQTITAPLTTGGIVTSGVSSGYHASNFVATNITAENFQSLLTGTNGDTSATMVGFDSTVDNGGTGNPALMAALRAKCSNSGGATAAKCIGVSVQAAANSGAIMTDISGIEIAAQTSGTNTNTAQAIKQTGASDISTFAGPIYWNGNRAFVTADFTTAANTNLQNITGLAFTLPANTAENVSFNCYVRYSQATAAAAVSFGVSASVAPAQINASGEIYTSSSVFAAGNLQGLVTTTATAIITGTPSATATIFNANFRGMIENPSQAASTINLMVKTATSGDAVTVKRGSYCVLGG